MKTPRALPTSAVLAALFAVPMVLLRAPASHADPTPAAASPSADPAASMSGGSGLAASASALASGSASAPARPAGPPRIADDPPPPEKSKTPVYADWKKAPLVTLDGKLGGDCESRRIREWIRIACKSPASSVSLLTGPAEGFMANLSPFEFKQNEEQDTSGWGGMVLPTLVGSYNLMFAVRRGDRRVYEVMGAEMSPQGPVPSTDYYVVVSWPEGEDPMVLIQRPLACMEAMTS